MKKLEINQCETINGGNFVEGFCDGAAYVGGGLTIGWALGLVAVPVWGWVTLAVVGVGCAVAT